MLRVQTVGWLVGWQQEHLGMFKNLLPVSSPLWNLAKSGLSLKMKAY